MSALEPSGTGPITSSGYGVDVVERRSAEGVDQLAVDEQPVGLDYWITPGRIILHVAIGQRWPLSPTKLDAG